MRGILLALMIGCCLPAMGCKGEGGVEKYTPSQNDARTAVETALKHWKEGQAKPSKFTMGAVKIEVVDMAWTEGQKLQEYEILAEEPVEGAGPRVFSVRLKTNKAAATVKYFVIGKDPLWVYGERDYKKLSGG